MSSVTIEDILEQVKLLTHEERKQLRDMLNSDARLERKAVRVQSAAKTLDLSRELRWIDEHRTQYAGQWVAVRGDRLLSHGTDPKLVYREAIEAGDESPFVTRVESANELPFAGW